MLQEVYIRYRYGCMKLFTIDEQNALIFLGTTFLIHSSGYLLTAAHVLSRHERLMVVPIPPDEDDFTPLSSDTLQAIPVHVAAMDKERDVALLAFDEPIEATMPDHVVGAPDQIVVGHGVACLGFGFGFQCVYNQLLQQAIICSKIRSTNDTNIFLFDSRVHDGSRGGPLVSMDDHRVIGIVSGRFDPLEASPATNDSGMHTSFSYAVSIEYALPLMEQQGLEII